MVRNSDLVMLDDSKSFGRVTDKLFNLSTHEVMEIQEALRERGHLTETNREISTSGGESSRGAQKKHALSLMKEIDGYLDNISQSDVRAAFASVLQLEQEKQQWEKTVDELEQARTASRLSELDGLVTEGRKAIADEEHLSKEDMKSIGDGLEELDEQEGLMPSCERAMHYSKVLASIAVLFFIACESHNNSANPEFLRSSWVNPQL